ncbi:DUF1853 family protein [Ferrimonas senticii]|uniref:DUF1853 family protein n=1 Tax=Ferrimonas senticii TaxID=394566 RepID=UPI00040BD1EE|nr:DUF1853 family protein [Ferrimonas senticii]
MFALPRLVRDLHWCLTSPPLYQQGAFVDSQWLSEFAAPLLAKLPQIAAAANQLGRPARLGHYYEQLWCALVNDHPHYQLLAHDLVIADHRRTHGALDLVVRNLKTEQIEHWELAVKFYLGEIDGSDPGNWIGPNRKDTLANKLEQLLSKQLPLSQTQLAKKLLAEKAWPIAAQRIILQGRLFQPKSQLALPPRLSEQAIIGRWYRQAQLPSQDWRMLSRQDWFGGHDWRTLPRWQNQHRCAYAQQLFDPLHQCYAFVVTDSWGE